VRGVIDAALAKNVAEARRLDAKLLPLHKAMFLESNPIPVKGAAARMGLIGDGIRLPLTPLAKQYHGMGGYGTMGEGVAVDAEGNVFAGEVGPVQGITKYVPRLTR
jgi:hypothetical protein